MTVLPIHVLGSPVLRQRATEVGQIDEELQQLVENLFETMRAAKGIGLAANQVGLTRRVAVVETGEDPPILLIDPVILEREGLDVAEEGCLSIPDIYGDVERAQRIVVETTTLEGSRERVDATDLRARAVQHEIDHLDGILFLDHLSMLKRRLILRKWEKQRKGERGYVREVPEVSAKD